MLQSEREQKILEMLQQHDIVAVKRLYEVLSDVSAVTVRRDLARMANEGKLLRVRGGIKRIPVWEEAPAAEKPAGKLFEGELAARLEADLELSADDNIQDLKQVDVIILPPIEGKLAKTIHLRARRTGVLCLDESSPDGEGVYLGVDNARAGFDVGCAAAQEFLGHDGQLHCLVIGHDSLTNTRERAVGFLKGLRETFGGEVHTISVDAGGVYMEAFRQARDAFEAFPQINLVFGINDHSALAAIDAARSRRLTGISTYCVGGEGSPLFEEFEKCDMLKGFAGMFPEVVARSALNAVTRFFSAERTADPVITPHRVITVKDFSDYYRKNGEHWELRPAIVEELAPLDCDSGKPAFHSLLFIRHYPTHHWYRALSEGFERHAKVLGYDYHTASVKSQVIDELRHTRRQIAVRASKLIKNGDTILINGGTISRHLATVLREHKDVTVITNSLAIIDVLSEYPDIKLMLTGGEFRSRTMDLVGPSISAILENFRIDTAFISVDGLSPEFGASCRDEREAKCLSTFSELGRKTVVMADHSIIGEDASFRAVSLEEIDEVVTDFGVSAQLRMAYSAHGVGMLVADDTGQSANAASTRLLT